MRRTRLYLLSLLFVMLGANTLQAQSDLLNRINEYGDFDNWNVREVKESGIIGGQVKQLYEFFGNQETEFTGKTPFKSPDYYPWRTNNVLAIVAGVVKTSNTVYPEPRDGGYCARIETHIEEVKALGVVNMDVVCQGALMIGELPEPIKDTKSPMSKVLYGVACNDTPKAVRFDYKADVGHTAVRGTGFSKMKVLDYPDYAEVTFILQKRWEDSEGRIHALRVATGIERFTENTEDWVNGHIVELKYGDITADDTYESYMGLKTDPETAYHAINSRGENVIVEEEGWAEPGTEPNYIVLHFISSCGIPFYGGVGNTLWVDNVEIVM
ncbi:MAG: PCMD domain-containing protein [Bacteroidales bacterium]|nr:PCMD domain-containing protein [Bacteroidales bacterium]